jgi:hypothetical protein
MDRTCSKNREKNIWMQILVGKFKGKKPFGSPNHRWEDNVKMDLTACTPCFKVLFQHLSVGMKENSKIFRATG